MSQFKLVSPFQPMGDQVQAIQELVDGLKAGKKEQVLLGELEQGKTLLLLNTNKRMSFRHVNVAFSTNKTLAGQFCSELKIFLKIRRQIHYNFN